MLTICIMNHFLMLNFVSSTYSFRLCFLVNEVAFLKKIGNCCHICCLES